MIMEGLEPTELLYIFIVKSIVTLLSPIPEITFKNKYSTMICSLSKDRDM